MGLKGLKSDCNLNITTIFAKQMPSTPRTILFLQRLSTCEGTTKSTHISEVQNSQKEQVKPIVTLSLTSQNVTKLQREKEQTSSRPRRWKAFSECSERILWPRLGLKSMTFPTIHGRQTHTHTWKGFEPCFFECCYGLMVSVQVDSTQSICGQPLTVMLPASLALISS